jgi:DNA repair exonuclease SbcCD ATPase subunit
MEHAMASLLRNLLGDPAKDRELAEDIRAVLQEMRRERERFEALIEGSSAAAERLSQLGEPLEKAGSDVLAVTARLRETEQRLEAVAQLASEVQSLGERSESLAQSQQQSEADFASVREDSQQIRATFEELSGKVDLAVSLKDRLEAFLEIEKPFQVLHGEADALRSQVEGTGEHLGRLRQQHERLMDAHKLGVSKMEALDRRRDELGRDLQDKERRIVGVEQAVRGMDGARQTVESVKRDLGALKALGDSLAQKTAALEAQGQAVDRALAQAESLERAMRQIETGMRQQQENEKSLGVMQEAVAALKGLHEEVVKRSEEISQLQRQTDEQAGLIRHELTAAQDGMKNAVERFDFENKGLESVSQRVADLRGALADFEHRFQGLSQAGQTVGELDARTQTLTGQVHGLLDDAQRIDGELRKLHALREGLDQAGRTTSEIESKVARILDGRPAVDDMLRDLEVLGGTHALVKDSLEQTQIAHDEIARMREAQVETRSWLAGVERSLAELTGQAGRLQDMAPTLELVQQQTRSIDEAVASIEARREFVEDLHRRVAELGTLGVDLDERGRDLQARMEAAEQRFVSLAERAGEAERVSKTVAKVAASVHEAVRRAEAVEQSVVSSEARCASVEGLAAGTEALKRELDQRQHALAEAAKDLQRASKLRQEAAHAAQKMDELARKLGETLTSAESRAATMAEVSAELESRVANLQVVDERLDEFEKRFATWELVDREVTRTLEQIAARQGTVQSVRTDLDRMFVMAEKTLADVRAITSAHRETAESRVLLDEVMGRLREIENATIGLDERQRQMTVAEDRLARAEGLLVDVQSSLEALQGQKAIVDQAVEKAGSLRFLLKQAEAMIEGLRDERKMTTDVRDAVAEVRDEDAEGDEEQSKAA